MKKNDFADLISEMEENDRKVMLPKNKEYSGGNADALASFKQIGNLLDLEPRKVCGVFFLKQALAVASILKTGGEISDEVRMNRFTDVRNYCVLAEGLMRDEEKEMIQPLRKVK